jgi:hypothetical protein
MDEMVPGSRTIAVADAGLEGYKSIIMVELILKIAVAENAAMFALLMPLEYCKFITYQKTVEPKGWRCATPRKCHITPWI